MASFYRRPAHLPPPRSPWAIVAQVALLALLIYLLFNVSDLFDRLSATRRPAVVAPVPDAP